MKVLHVNDYYSERGGVEQYILAVSQLLAENGHSSAILYCRHTPYTVQTDPRPAYFVDVDKEAVVSEVRRVVVQERPDIAYIHHVSSPALVEALSRFVPTVAYIHGFTAVCPGLAKYFRRGDAVCRRAFGWGCVPMHYLRRCSAARHPRTLLRLMRNTAALRQALLKVSGFLVGSRYMSDLLVQNGFPAERITVLPPHFLPDGIELAYRPSEEPKSVLFVGRLEIEKGFPYLLRAIAELPVARLMVAGEGTQRALYEALACELGLGNRVDFLGWLDSAEMERAYIRCSLVAMPSVCPESFGKVGIEALAHGRPVVAFNVGGIADWLRDGINGFLVRPKDTRELADRIGRLLQDEPLRLRLGQAGQATLGQRYAASQHLATLLAVFGSAR